MRKTHFKKVQVVSFVGHSRLGLSREVTREIQPGKNCSDSSICFSRDLLRVVHPRVNRKPVANFTFFTNFHQTLTLNPYIKSNKNTGK